MSEIILNKENFKEVVLQSKKPVVVDFFATWCGPCRAMGGVVSKLAAESDGRYAVGKIDIDEQEELATEYGIMSVPTIKIFKDGEVVKTFVGITTAQEILKEVNPDR